MKIDLFIFNSNKFKEEEIINRFQLRDDEILPFKKIVNEEVRKEKIVSYYLKKKLVGKYHIGEKGKPLSENCYFNVSHSRGYVLLAKCECCPIGLDVELIRPVDDLLKQYVCNPEEYKYAKDYQKFYEIWTVKESIVKCTGEGIDIHPNKIPALPTNGKRIFLYDSFNTKTCKYENLMIAVTIKGNADFEIKSYLV